MKSTIFEKSRFLTPFRMAVGSGFRSDINDLVDLVPFFCFDHNAQQSGIAATQYIVVFCYALILNQENH